MQVFRPVLNTDFILEGLEPILKKGWIGLGEKVERLEKAIAEYIGVKYCVCLNSCTSALHLAIKSLGLQKGDKVLTTPMTFVSTNHALLYEGLEPVFYDVEKTTGNPCMPCVKEAIEQYDIKAIMVVHFAGYPCEMDEINDYGIPVIEDCAHAFGAEYKEKKVGDTDNLCCWSFHAVKNLPMGDGGAVTTNNKDIYEWLKKMRWCGIDKSTHDRSKGNYKWEYNVDMVGYKYHMNDITAVIGLNQLWGFESEQNKRMQIANYYLKHCRAIKPQYEQDRKSSYHFLPMFFDDRDKVYKNLVKNDIYPSMHYKPNYYYPMYENCIRINECRNTEWYYQRELTLPLHLDMTEEDVKFVCEVVNEKS